jgi:hypothetical protein
MVLIHRIPALTLLIGAFLAAATAGAATPAVDQVTLPLAEYLALLDRAEALAKEAQAVGRQAPPLSEVMEQKTTLIWREGEAGGEPELTTRTELDVLVQGQPAQAVGLPIAGYVQSGRVERLDAKPGAPATHAALAPVAGGGMVLVATEPARYRIIAEGRAPLTRTNGGQRLVLPQVVAPVATTEIELPAELEWHCPGAVVVGDSVAGDRRTLRLATSRGQTPVLETRRRFAGQDAEQVLAHTVVLTLFQLRPEGPRRHDVIYYEVARGQVASFVVDLPPGLEVEQAATDEGPIVPLLDGRRLKVERQRQLQGNGYLVLTSTPAAGAAFPWQTPRPEHEVRARFLATASSIAATVAPAPAALFQQVDLDDLPYALREALQAAELAAAWRATPELDATSEARLEVAALPAAASLALTVTDRDTTTLMTVDGTLLHREVFRLALGTQPLAAFELELPAGATLWSAKLDGEAIRPLERDGRLSVPLTLRGDQQTTVEVVTVLDRALAAGRTQLEIALARSTAPVLVHRWRVLLPADRRYRYHHGDLQVAPEEPAAMAVLGIVANEEMVMDRITVMTESPLLDQKSSKPASAAVRESEAASKRARADLDELKAKGLARVELEGLQQGLVGGVRPLPITIPESGKALYLTGVLPPASVSVTIDVKAR